MCICVKILSENISNSSVVFIMGFFDIVNIYGLIIAVVLLVPHIIYVKTHTIDKNKFTNRAMVYIDRTGRFFSLFLMAFNLGILEQGFTEPKELMRNFWMITVFALALIYILLWLIFFKTGNKGVALATILISAFIFIFSGILQVKTLLMTAGIVYLIGELYIFSQYFKDK